MNKSFLGTALAFAMVLSWSLFAQAEAPKQRPAGKPGQAGQRPQGRPSPEMMAKILEKFDANKNGRLDPDEMQTARAEFQKMRANGGPASKGAPGAAGKGAPDAAKRAEIIKKFDKDGDGQLNEAERAAAKAAFANKGNK